MKESEDETTVAMTTVTSHSTCLVLRGISSMETDDHVTSVMSCADDVSVHDVIETCSGAKPLLLSKRFIDRRRLISGRHWHAEG